MDKKEQIKKAEIVLLDILRGYSILQAEEKCLYFKHFSLLDSLVFEEEYHLSLASAKKSGIKDEKQIIDDAVKSKKWSIQKEEQIKSLIWTINKLSAATKKISDPYQKRSAENSVKERQEELHKLEKNRSEICSFSAESFAQNKKIKKIISSCLYEDLEFKDKIDSDSITYYYNSIFFDKISELNNQNIILTAAYNTSFFEVFCLNYRTPHIILKNSGMDMTVFQKNLLVYANALLNKLKNTNIPEAIIEDPIKVLNYKEQENDNGKKTSIGTEDLKEKMAKNGGKLNPEDLIT